MNIERPRVIRTKETIQETIVTGLHSAETSLFGLLYSGSGKTKSFEQSG